MLLNFYKMHSLGNDFVVLDLISQNIKLHSSHLKRIAHRNLGIGCDQIIIIEPPIKPDANFFARIYNPNGLEAEQCGNGVRCAAKLFYDCGLSDVKKLKADCLAGRLEFFIEKDSSVSVDMGAPELLLEGKSSKEFTVDGYNYLLHFASFGNPHAVVFVDNLNLDIPKIGKQLSENKFFSNGCNIEFVEVISKSEINIRVYERGVGETFACGSGACAAVSVGQKLEKLNNPIVVNFKFGSLKVEKKDNNYILNGPTNSVFAGQCRF